MIARLLVFCLAAFFHQPILAQSRPETALRFSKEILLQLEVGLATTFLSMDSENDLLREIDKFDELSHSKLSGNAGFSVGGGLFMPTTGIRLRFSHRNEKYTNRYDNFLSSFFSTILFLSQAHPKFDLTHSIATTTVHLEKMISTEANYQGLIAGIGGFYGWISDEREELLVIMRNSNNVKIKNKILIDSDIAGINLILGKYFENGWTWLEFRPGYQFLIKSAIKSEDEPGKSSDGFKPDFSGFTLHITCGFSI